MNVSAATGNFTLIEAASGVNNLARFNFTAIPGLTLTPALGTDNSKTQLKIGVAVTDVTPPTAGTGVNTGTPAAVSVPLTWEAGSDGETPVTNLHYSVYQSSSDNITTVANAEANGTLLNAGNNFTSHTATGLTPNTTYYFNVVVKDAANNKAAYTSVQVTTAKATLEGTPLIAGNAVFGQALTVNIAGLASIPSVALGAVSYQWNRNDTPIPGATSSTYTLVQEDIANTITVKITTENTRGFVTSPATATVAKADQAVPAAPTLASATHNSITLNTIAGAEYYCMQTPGFQDSPTFTGLQPEQSYAFAARMKATATHNESETTAFVMFSTLVEPAVTSVTVSPASATVQKGQTQQFSATVVAVGGASNAVTWSIVEAHNAGTAISASGLLTVAAAETANSLTVKAISTFDGTVSGTSSVTLTAAPTVTAVEVTANASEVLPGNTLQFSAAVTAEGGASTAVNWTIVGAKHVNTSISASGLLSVSSEETAGAITVKATSTFNSAVYDELTVNVPAIMTINVTPATVSVQKGTTQQFAATVTAVGGATTDVTWSIVEAHNAGTTISASGLLTVAAAESATTLTIRATSVFNTNVTGSAIVTVTTAPVTPEVIAVTIDPASATVQKGSSRQFTHTIEAIGGASTAVTWSVTGASAATVSNTGLLTVPASETASSITVKVTSDFNTAKFATATVTLTAAPVVNSVTVTPATASVQKGESQQFNAAVSAAGGASTAVTWSVEGANDAGTDIDGTGFLTVAAGETASSLTVKATSNFDSQKVGSATVTITNLTGIEEITVEENDNTLKLYIENGILKLGNAEMFEGERIMIFDISGRIILNFQFSIFDSINVSHWPAGVYLVKTGNYTGKFVKKQG
jgi:hypothetical protein